ncbi:MAG: aldo/keto reductase [Bacteroidetes bacterium]|nr:aldo/keto reductase [Bacteroidota bacterium]MBL6942863.1 aldo/keto reductase [Bacteroidales bacterium]
MVQNKIKLNSKLEFSRVVHGHWRLADWRMSNQELLKLTEQAIELGVTTFDHADIYGDYSCERLFGKALNLKKEIRNHIQIITKCGIKLASNKFPLREHKIYDYSFEHIVSSVDNSLKSLRTDYIDLLLLHRPAPFFNPEEVAMAFSSLKKSGKALHFGVSNFNPLQFEMLNSYTDEKLVTNQVEISPYCLENFENGNIDFFLKIEIMPMAWSPLAGGKLINPQNEKGQRIYRALSEVAEELNVDILAKIIYSWLLNHPASIIPIVGTGKIERIKFAVEALNINMSLTQWYKIYTASTGKELD